MTGTGSVADNDDDNVPTGDGNPLTIWPFVGLLLLCPLLSNDNNNNNHTMCVNFDLV